MKVFLHRYITKFTITALLIAGIILLCPINPVSSVTTSCDTSAISMSNHNTSDNGTNSDCSKTHPELGNHVANLLTASNYSALLLFTAITVLFFFSHRLLSTNKIYLTKINYFQHRYKIIIKPKLETKLHRWLNLLGGSVALSF